MSLTPRDDDDEPVHGFINPYPELNAGLWCLFLGATAFLALRLWVKITRRHGMWYDDYILIVSWVSVSLMPPVPTPTNKSQGRPSCNRLPHRLPIWKRLRPRKLQATMGRPHAHPHQHLIMRQPDRSSMDKDGIWRDAASNEQPMAAGYPLVLHRHHEHLDGLEGHLSVGQGVR